MKRILGDFVIDPWASFALDYDKLVNQFGIKKFDEVLDVFPAQVTRDSGTTETLTISCNGYNTVTQDVTFDTTSEAELTVTLEKEQTNEEPADGE